MLDWIKIWANRNRVYQPASLKDLCKAVIIHNPIYKKATSQEPCLPQELKIELMDDNNKKEDLEFNKSMIKFNCDY